MLAMGYVAGTGLGARGGGRVLPVEARAGPPARSLDHCMELAEKERERDPLKVEQKLKRMRKKEEERNKRAYEREKERERRNVFNFLNNTLGDKSASEPTTANPMPDIKQSTSKDLNIEQFKINEETKRLEREIVKLNSSLQRQTAGSSGHRGINVQLAEKNKELNVLRNKEKQIAKEQRHRQDKQKMTVF
ncbi:unnamed protein product [Plutella xylostella]|uniref:(diamondback moth) hypothetical protein n=1 Tax=Plutella xylostella TaxID=51655 RepID=A0A8S4E6K8_PLUXY|nr:unnamed protein product [Plutella xylostella]